MSLHRFASLLATVSTAAANTTGDAKAVRPGTYDDVPNHQQGWGAIWQGTMAGSSSPTQDCDIETSWDGGTTWVVAASFTQITSASTFAEHKAITAALGPHVRAKITGGGDGTFAGKVYLTSDGKFSLAAAS